MNRRVLEAQRVHPAIRARVEESNREIVDEVEQAIAGNDVVVVGMMHNPHSSRARAVLKGAGVPFKYLQYGSYVGPWRRRNALKMWTGWPTFPMVFVRGVLVGGANEISALLESGELTQLQSAGAQQTSA